MEENFQWQETYHSQHGKLLDKNTKGLIMSDSISEGYKEDKEREKIDFLLKEKENARQLEKLLKKIEETRVELNSLCDEYRYLKQNFINFGYIIDDSDELKISKCISW